MKWFKAFPIEHEIMLPFFKMLGYEGYGMALQVIAEATTLELTEIDAIHLKRWFGFRTKKAERLLPKFQELWVNYRRITGELRPNYDHNSTELRPNYDHNSTELRPNYDHNSTVTMASNPRGSIKEEENRLDKREENNTPLHPPKGIAHDNVKILTIEQQDRFNRFWAAYPKKKGKGQAEKTFKRINPSEQLLATMLAKIERATTSDDWRKENGEFIPFPGTWLNQKRWEDEVADGTGKPVPKTRPNTHAENLREWPFIMCALVMKTYRREAITFDWGNEEATLPCGRIVPLQALTKGDEVYVFD